MCVFVLNSPNPMNALPITTQTGWLVYAEPTIPIQRIQTGWSDSLFHYPSTSVPTTDANSSPTVGHSRSCFCSVSFDMPLRAIFRFNASDLPALTFHFEQ
mmetsp:Transcript_45066/g.109039  ORF Transcript_45066/g.109039 Transcript_45066/m.109039 type:complete len:100 (+) Transcript_45066:83-382(+)